MQAVAGMAGAVLTSCQLRGICCGPCLLAPPTRFLPGRRFKAICGGCFLLLLAAVKLSCSGVEQRWRQLAGGARPSCHQQLARGGK
jgi:hypothetical protein